MKKSALFISLAFAVTSCYEPYIKDFEHSGVYVAYQYDLRSLVVGEGMTFDLGCVLGGVTENDRDRHVSIMLDDELVTGSLQAYGGTTAYDGLMNLPSQSYVSTAMINAKLKTIQLLPREYFTLSEKENLVIREGTHTAVTSFHVDSLAILSDPNIGKSPYYAFGYRIIGADADIVLPNKCFGIIAIQLQNMFFGDWYHGGKSVTYDADGNVIEGSETVYPTTIPANGNSYSVYALATNDAYSCTTKFFHNVSGKMTIGMDGTNVTISGTKGSGKKLQTIVDRGCSWNGAAKIQDRKIFLNYEYNNTDGTITVVTDTLSFRARTRDGVNEWQQ